MANPTHLSRYRVDGMDCASCATKIATAVRRVPGVEDVSVSATAGTMTVRHGEGDSIAPAIAKKVTGLGYKLTVIPGRSTDDAPANATEASAAGHDHKHEGDQHDHDHDHSGHGHDHDHDPAHSHRHGDGHDHGPTTGSWWRSGKGQLTIASGAALVAAYAVGKLVPSFEPWIFTAAMLVGLVPIARRAVMAALAGTPFSIEMLMTIAAVGAVIRRQTPRGRP